MYLRVMSCAILSGWFGLAPWVARAESPLLGWRVGVEAGVARHERGLDISRHIASGINRLDGEIREGGRRVEEGRAALSEGDARIAQGAGLLEAGRAALASEAARLSALEEGLSSARSALARGEADLARGVAERDMVAALLAGLPEVVDNPLAGLPGQPSVVPNPAAAQARSALAEAERRVADGRALLDARRGELAAGEARAARGRASLEEARARLSEGEGRLAQGQAERAAGAARLAAEQDRLARALALRDRVSALPRVVDAGGTGFHLRGSAGYAMRVRGPFTLGLEGDINWHPSASSVVLPPSRLDGPDTVVRTRMDMSAGFNIRAGWLLTDRLMPWAALGGEIVRFQGSANFGDGGRIDRIIPGLRVGGGLDWAPVPGKPFFVRAGYEYTRHLDVSSADVAMRSERHSFRVGFHRSF